MSKTRAPGLSRPMHREARSAAVTENLMTWLQSLAGRRLLVTGGAGFIGGRVVELAARAGAHVTALVRGQAGGARLQAAVGKVVADVRQFAQVRAALIAARPELVVHAAGIPNWRQDPGLTLSMMEVQALGTAHVLEASRETGVQRVVLVGSMSEYGDAPSPLVESGPRRPLDPYAASKIAATELGLVYHRSFGLPTTLVRPFVVYGPGEPQARLFPSLFAAALGGGGAAPFTPGEQVRDFVYVDDAAAGVLRALVSGLAAGEIINLGTGVGTSVRDAVRLAAAISGGSVRPDFGALPYRPGEPACMVASTGHCAELLGWTPSISLADGLSAYWGAAQRAAAAAGAA